MLRCAMDFKFRNCSDLYFEKNPWGIKYLQKISSCVNNRKIQYSASGPVFNKFENFMILLLLFIAYFICQCLFSQAAWIWLFDHLMPTRRPNSPCREPPALPRQRRGPLRPGPLAAPMGHAQGRVSGRGFLCHAMPCPPAVPVLATALQQRDAVAWGVPAGPRVQREPRRGGGLRRVVAT